MDLRVQRENSGINDKISIQRLKYNYAKQRCYNHIAMYLTNQRFNNTKRHY